MAIHVNKLISGGLSIIVGSKDMDEFKQFIQRAANVHPDASPKMKEFADIITHDGIVMQDYYTQANKSRED